MDENKVLVTFTLELCEAEWLEGYLRGNHTTLSEKMRFAVTRGIDSLLAKRRYEQLDEQIRGLILERDAAAERIIR